MSALFLKIALLLWASQSPAHALLDVPFVSQTPALCGGAAVSMVLRYWGARDVFPQDFAPLVSEDEAGIFTGVLENAVRDRGWTALTLPGENGRKRLQSEVDQGRPIIVLIRVAPRMFHYVVIVGATDTEVVFHDPARAPFRVLDWAAFDRAWAESGRWSMLILPPADGIAVTPEAKSAAARRTTVCTPLVDHAVERALAGEPDVAEAELTAATRLCPSDPAAWLELGGLRFSEKRWPDADRLATVGASLDPANAYAWRLAGTSRYLNGDVERALDAWNHAGEPTIDAIDVHGASRTPEPVVVRAIGLEPRAVLTARSLTQASRRLRDLPVVSGARMKYESLPDGRVRVDATVVERPRMPSGWPALIRLGVGAVARHEIRADVAGALGAGELLTAAWRWDATRPRVGFRLAAPSPWTHGTTRVDASWERQSYASLPSERRRRAGFEFADWATSWMQWTAGAAIDHFDGRRFVAVDAALDTRFARDRIALSMSTSRWFTTADTGAVATFGASARWRSTSDVGRGAWSSVVAFHSASDAAPHALWPGAGTGSGRPLLLRAHRLLVDGVIAGPAFGRDLTNGTLEYSHPVVRTPGGRLAFAGFVDAARAARRLSGLDRSPVFVDAGVGMRLQLPGGDSVVRLDLAHGLRGGATTLSIGWSAGWPR